MTPEQVIDRVRQDKGIKSRFPLRIIFVDQFDQYKMITNKLAAICDGTINIADFCGGTDTYPDFAKIQNLLIEQPSRQIQLLGMGEYLRFAFSREKNAQRRQLISLWNKQQNAQDTARIILPMYACYDLWERVVPAVDERQAEHIWRVDATSFTQDRVKVTVFSDAFSSLLPVVGASYGITQWLTSWEHLVEQQESCRVVTRLYRNVETSSGIYEVSVIKSPFEYLRTQMPDAASLKPEWGSEHLWGFLLKQCTEQTTCLQELLLHLLNMETFSLAAILSNWEQLSQEKQWLVWLWYRLFQDKGYAGNVILHSEKPSDIPHHIYFYLLNLSVRPEAWKEERYTLLCSMHFVPQEEEMQQAFSNIPNQSEKLSLLLCRSHIERTYAISVAEKWLSIGGKASSIAKVIREKFPVLAEYIDPHPLDQEKVDSYFNSYRKAKLQSTVSVDFQETRMALSLEEFNSRYSYLSNYNDHDNFILWVDALGAEWIPCLSELSNNLQNGQLAHCEIAQAILPTETCFNDVWHTMVADYKKLDALDKLAHMGQPDEHSYHSCLDSEFAFIENLLPIIDEKLQTYPRVIVTGDHGTSRLAAIAFHKISGTQLPEKAISKSLGRYCELGRPYDPLHDGDAENTVWVKENGKEYLVIRNYEHYKQSGKAVSFEEDTALIGELHGGATPEEALVPVMVFTSNIVKHKSITFTVKQGTSWKRTQRKTVATVQLDTCVENLSAVLSNEYNDCHATCKRIDNSSWELTFVDVFLGKANLKMIADGQLLTQTPVVRIEAAGLSRNDDLFGDL